MKVRASSDSINTRLIDKAFCLVNKYQQIKKKKRQVESSVVLQRRQLRGVKEQNTEFTWR